RVVGAGADAGVGAAAGAGADPRSAARNAGGGGGAAGGGRRGLGDSAGRGLRLGREHGAVQGHRVRVGVHGAGRCGGGGVRRGGGRGGGGFGAAGPQGDAGHVGPAVGRRIAFTRKVNVCFANNIDWGGDRSRPL